MTGPRHGSSFSNTSTARARPPDVLIVVLDCLRAKSIAPWDKNGVVPPFLSELARDSVTYRRCLSVAPWSLPSHVSLFTGLYPWRHRVYGRGAPRLPSDLATIAETLSSRHYRTLSLSANPFVSAKRDIVRGFQTAYWGDWASHYMPFLSRIGTARGFVDPDVGLLPSATRGGWAHKIELACADSAVAAVPSAWKLAHLLATTLNHDYARHSKPASPWIEPTFESWLTRISLDVPCMSFINLMDLHEPYFESSESWSEASTVIGRSKLLLGSMDRHQSVWSEQDPVVRELAERYRALVLRVDERVRRLVEIFDRRRGCNESLIIITSDHGQNFGERGHLFHTEDTGDEMLRVPLLVRLPGREHRNVTTDTWASLIDIFPTILDACSFQANPSHEGESLNRLVSTSRRAPVLALGDGPSGYRPIPSIRPSNVNSTLRIVACLDDYRREFESGTPIRQASAGGETRAIEGSRTEAEVRIGEAIEQQARNALALLGRSVYTRVGEPVSGHRLEGWGY